MGKKKGKKGGKGDGEKKEPAPSTSESETPQPSQPKPQEPQPQVTETPQQQVSAPPQQIQQPQQQQQGQGKSKKGKGPQKGKGPPGETQGPPPQQQQPTGVPQTPQGPPQQQGQVHPQPSGPWGKRPAGPPQTLQGPSQPQVPTQLQGPPHPQGQVPIQPSGAWGKCPAGPPQTIQGPPQQQVLSQPPGLYQVQAQYQQQGPPQPPGLYQVQGQYQQQIPMQPPGLLYQAQGPYLPQAQYQPVQPQGQFPAQASGAGAWGKHPAGPPQISQGPYQHPQGLIQQTQVPIQQAQVPMQHPQGAIQHPQVPIQHPQGPIQQLQGQAPPQHVRGLPQQEGQPPVREMEQVPAQRPGGPAPKGKGAKKKATAGAAGPSPPSQASQQTAGVEAIQSQLSDVHLRSGGVLPAEKGILVQPGTAGRKILVETNHFKFDLGNLREAMHYDIEFEPDVPKSLLRRAFEQFRKDNFTKRHPAFDGRKNVYSAGYLPFGEHISGEVNVLDDEGRSKKFKIAMKIANIIDLTVLLEKRNVLAVYQNALQCIDVVLRSAPVRRLCIPVGRSFFTQPEPRQIVKLGNGMEMYYGFYQTAVRGWTTYLNVDVSHKAFPTEQPVERAILEVLSSRFYAADDRIFGGPLRNLDYVKVNKFLKLLKVTCQLPNVPSSKRQYRINGLGEPASTAKFKFNDKVITVQEYYMREKNYRLKYPHFHTLWVGNAQRQDKVLIPMELCIILPKQALNRKMNEDQTSAMIKVAATNTKDRKRKIETSIQQARYNDDPTVKEFGFNVGNTFEKIEARVLTPPRLLYDNKKVVTPTKGVWRSERFLQPANQGLSPVIWSIMFVGRAFTDTEEFIKMVNQLCRQNGIPMAAPIRPFVHVERSSIASVKNELTKLKKQHKLNLIFVVIPDSGLEYSHVKSAAELNVGCLTQCIKLVTMKRKLNIQTVANILLKVNSKLNGVNHCLNERPRIMSEPCMIMGADVTHPGPDSDTPSVAAVTASHDPKAFCYNICWRLQSPRVEIIEDLAKITKEQLIFFYKKTNCKPKRIVFFRDGVSEGQFDQVRQFEISCIQKACRELEAEYEPKITFLVVQKRHHTRLFPVNDRDCEDRNFNVPAGTCVDTNITNPVVQDFYLVSHASIQGVAKPTKYCTLHDDNALTNDEIEALAYYLCHMFSRCTRSVSYPAPTYYAHLAAARAKVYIENENLNMNELQREQGNYVITDAIRKELPMFFV